MPTTFAEIPHLAIPFDITPDGREHLVEQGTVEEMRQHAETAARIQRGTLDADPAFGTSDQTFREGGVDAGRLAAELVECDPRPGLDIDQALDAATTEVVVRVTGGA